MELHLNCARDLARFGCVILNFLQLDLLKIHGSRRATEELKALRWDSNAGTRGKIPLQALCLVQADRISFQEAQDNRYGGR